MHIRQCLHKSDLLTLAFDGVLNQKERTMKRRLKSTLTLSVAAALMLPMPFAAADGKHTKKVSIKNISNAVFTPPIVALCKRKMKPIAKVGAPASDAVELLAEGGDTSGLAMLFDDNHCHYVSSMEPILPGETLSLEVPGRGKYLHLAAMLLPTNDGFIFTSGHKVSHHKHSKKLMLKSYDAGTEFNDELCANIPGPQCGGMGFNAEREDHNFVKPHPGLQGFGDVSAATYNWGEPVAYVTVK